MDAAIDDPGPGRLTSPPTPGDLLRVEVTVPLGVEAAFALFTEGTAGWWPAPSVTGSMSIDAEVGGRWGERTTDGDERPWGTVTRWEPPRRIGLSWAADDDAASAVDVRFAAVEDRLTTVIVEHRGLAVHDAATRARIGGDDGWWAILRAYAATARA